MSEAGLGGLRVVEVGGGVSAPMAGKLLADLGATVVKVEPPGGDPARQRGPFRDGRPDPEASGTFLYLNTNKRSVTLELDGEPGRSALAELAAEADVVVHDLAPARMAAAGLDYARLSARNPRLVLVSVTPFGLTGPYRDYAGADLVLIHGGGVGWLCPDTSPPPERPPIRPFGRHALTQAGIHAACVALGAVYGAARTGRGEHVDVSVQEVVAGQLGRHFVSYTYPGRVESRLGRNLTAPATYFPCRDGTIYLIAVEQDQWTRLVELMGAPAWAQDEAFGSTALRGVPETMETINARLAEWTVGWEVDALFHACQARRIGSAPVFPAGRLADEAHLAARGFFTECAHPVAGRLRLPGPPYALERPWWALRRPAPLLGEADAEAKGAPARLFPPRNGAGAEPAPEQAVPGTDDAPPERPLAGVRVLDLSWVWAGPYGTQMLGFLGAEVIKVESSRRMDLARRLDLYASGLEPGPNRNGYFNQLGQDKLSAAINLGHPEGLALVKRLAAESDVVVSNFATGVMERLGLGRDVLLGLKPELILATISAFGKTGPYRNYLGYGPLMIPLAGLGYSTGYAEDGAPQNLRIAYADPNSGAYMAVAVLAALVHKQRTGEGQVIDVSLWEALICTAFEGWMAHALGGEAPRPMGNHDPQHAPHNLYRCAGEDEWVAVAVTDEAQWRALCAVMERPGLADDPRFAGAPARKTHEARLDEIVADWCAPRDKWAVTAALQAAGVPAFPSLRNRELAESGHLEARGFLSRLAHPEVGVRAHTGVPWRLAQRPNGVQRRAPLLGEHTDAVLTGLLGLDGAEVARLRAEGAIE